VKAIIGCKVLISENYPDAPQKKVLDRINRIYWIKLRKVFRQDQQECYKKEKITGQDQQDIRNRK
jgi:hypothetical protein